MQSVWVRDVIEDVALAACATHPVRSMPKLASPSSITLCLEIGCQKLGQPVPESIELDGIVVQRRGAACAAIKAACL